MNEDLISLCLTTYNRADTLPVTIDSILNQTFSHFELIISDDNSKDATKEVCERYAAADKRVKYFQNTSNLKMPGNLNAAISHAKGNYIANLHDGDVYRNDLIERWYQILKRFPEALFVFNQYRELDFLGNTVKIYDHHLNEVNDGKVLMEYFIKTLTSGPWGTVMARREAYDLHGFFNPAFGFISDVEMWLRLGLAGKVCYVNSPLIDLTPREKKHPYFLPHWKIFCLKILILIEYYPLYIKKYPSLKESYPVSSILNRIEKNAMQDMSTLIKHMNLNRIREGIFVFKHLPLKTLNALGRFSSVCQLFPKDYYAEVDRLKIMMKQFIKI